MPGQLGQALANLGADYSDRARERRRLADALEAERAQSEGYVNPLQSLSAPTQDKRSLGARLGEAINPFNDNTVKLPEGQTDNRSFFQKLSGANVDPYSQADRSNYAIGQNKFAMDAQKEAAKQRTTPGAGKIEIDEGNEVVTYLPDPRFPSDKAKWQEIGRSPKFKPEGDAASPQVLTPAAFRSVYESVTGDAGYDPAKPEFAGVSKIVPDNTSINPQNYNTLLEAQRRLRAGVNAGKAKEEEGKNKVTQTKEQSQIADKFRDEYRADEKLYKESRQGYEAIKNAAEKNKFSATGVPSLRLVYAFQRLIDPGSMVRGEDVQTLGKSGGLSATVQTLFDSMTTGTRLDGSVVNEMLQIANTEFANREEDFRDTHSTYTDRASRAGLNPDDVVTPRWAREWSKQAPAKPVGQLKPRQ